MALLCVGSATPCTADDGVQDHGKDGTVGVRVKNPWKILTFPVNFVRILIGDDLMNTFANKLRFVFFNPTKFFTKYLGKIIKHIKKYINNDVAFIEKQENGAVIPVLFTTFNRLEYTKKSLEILLDSCEKIIVIDNASTDGTREYLEGIKSDKFKVIFNTENLGVRGAMQTFFNITKDYKWVGKVDNDTIVPKDWLIRLKKCAEENNLDIVQAKHAIIKATNKDGWGGFIKHMTQLSKGVYENNFVGGSGVIIRRSVIREELPNTGWVLGGWFDWQLKHPEIRKGFCEDVEIELLDTNENGEDYSRYPEYYIFTKRN